MPSHKTTGLPVAIHSDLMRDIMATMLSYQELEQRVKDLEEELQHFKKIEKENIADPITDHRWSQQELVGSLEQYRQTLDAMGDPIHVVTKNLEIVLFNRVFNEWNEKLGLETDVIGKNIFDVFPFLPDRIRTEYQQVFESGKVLVTEERSVLEGQEIVTHTRKIPVFEEGRVVRVLTVVYDITERWLREKALSESEARYRDLVGLSPDPIVILQDNRYQFVNAAFEEVFGYSQQDVDNGVSFFDLVQESDKEAVSKRYKKRLMGKNLPKTYRIDLVSKDGTRIPCETSAALIQYQGRPADLVIIRDLGERREAEKRLKRKVAELDTLINNIPDMAWIKDADSRFIAVNSAFCAAVDMSPEMLIGHTCEVCFGQEKAVQFREDDLQVMKSGKQTVLEERIADSREHEIWLETIKSPIQDASGNVVGTVGIARDITKRKKAEEKLRKAHETLEKAVQKRTSQLQEANERLEKLNTGLHVLIEHRQQEMRRLEENVVENVTKLITPYIEKIDKRRMGSQNKAYLEVIIQGLTEIVSPFSNTLSSKHTVLTPTEIRVSDLVRQGKTSKEIASLLNVSANAITVHRYNIRRKLGLLNKKVNLRSYLQSLSP
jgi:PAS domain S-box-containing protein